MPANFPDNPTSGDEAVLLGRTYVYDGKAWNIKNNDFDSPTFTGTSSFLGGAVFKAGVIESFTKFTGSVDATLDHDCQNGHVFYHSPPTSDFAANVVNLDLDVNQTVTIIIILNQSATAFMVSGLQVDGVSVTITWQGGIVPSGTDNGIDAMAFTLLNDNGSYVVLGQSVPFGG